MNLRVSTFLILCASALSLSAQNKFSADVYSGILFPQTDLSLNTYEGYSPNLAVGAGIGFNVADAVRIKGDLMYGNLNGNDASRYYEAVIFEPKLGFDINLIQLFTEWDKLKINLYGGTGLSLYQSTLYSTADRSRLAESPVPANSSLSPNAFVAGGAFLSIPFSDKLEFNVGYVQRNLFNTPYLDVVEAGEATDHYGSLTAGLTFYLKSDRTPGTVEVDESKHMQLKADSESMKTVQEELNESEAEREDLSRQVAVQKSKIEELEAKVEELETRPVAAAPLTSTPANAGARGNTATTTSSSGGDVIRGTSENANAQLQYPQYRLVVASLPSEGHANRWINSSRNLDMSDAFVAYAQSVNSYRVVYRSFQSYEAARKELQTIKSDFPDAWIIKF